jgi:hypothetical protein
MKNLNILDTYPDKLPSQYAYTRLGWLHNFTLSSGFLKNKVPFINGWVPYSKNLNLLQSCGFVLSNIYDKLFFQDYMVILNDDMQPSSYRPNQNEKVIQIPHFIKQLNQVIEHVYTCIDYETQYLDLNIVQHEKIWYLTTMSGLKLAQLPSNVYLDSDKLITDTLKYSPY